MRWGALVAVCMAFIAMPVKAGCELVNPANYQVGTNALITVSKDDPVGKLLSRGTSAGDMGELLRCDSGPVTFRGAWLPDAMDEVRPLMVGGQRSGVGVRLRLAETGYEDGRQFPYIAVRSMAPDETVRSDGDLLEYEFVRMADPLLFGAVDPGAVAETRVDRPSGGWVTFRSMKIYELALNRPACSLEADDLNQRVPLPPATVKDFDGPEGATAWQAFRVRVLACSDPEGLVARVRFGVASDAATGATDLFSLPGGPEHTALEIGGPDHHTMAPGVARDLPAESTGGHYEFSARLRALGGAPGAGRFERHIRLEVEFL